MAISYASPPYLLVSSGIASPAVHSDPSPTHLVLKLIDEECWRSLLSPALQSLLYIPVNISATTGSLDFLLDAQADL
jgi:hypothetical protein